MSLVKLDVVGARCYPISLELPETLNEKEWTRIGNKLLRSGKMLHWWIGDWLAYGLNKWGDTVKELKELTEYADQTLWNMAYVSRAVPSSRRREDLPWSFHAEVASLPDDEQKLWLDKAAEAGVTRMEFRKQIRSATATRALNEPDYKPFDLATRHARELARWLAGQPEEFWTEERRSLWRQELQPLHDFYVKLS